MYTNEQLNSIFLSIVGFEFEFFSKKDLNIVQKELASVLNKKIRIEDKAHSDFKPTRDEFKLEPDNSGGVGMIELVTGPIPFNESKLILAKTLKWIKENGYTNDKCSIHINLAFDNKVRRFNMSNLDVGKFVLNFNESKIYKHFPNRKNSVYAKSIKFVTPLNGMTQFSDAAVHWKNYSFVKEKYYGVNFTKLAKGYLEFRYIGGKNYEQRYDSILELTEYFIISLYETLKNPSYNQNDINELKGILKKHKNIIKSYKSYNNFKEMYPDIKLTVDLKSNNKTIELYYPKIRESIFKLLTEAGITQGCVNYDSDIGRIQVKDVKVEKCFKIEGCDIVESNIRGNIEHCDIFNSNIVDSSLDECNVFGYSKINDSKLENSYVSRNVQTKNCYVAGNMGVFSGSMDGGIFRKGRATKHAQFNGAEIIEIEKIK